jgi:hypothetical protein
VCKERRCGLVQLGCVLDQVLGVATVGCASSGPVRRIREPESMKLAANNKLVWWTVSVWVRGPRGYGDVRVNYRGRLLNRVREGGGA